MSFVKAKLKDKQKKIMLTALQTGTEDAIAVLTARSTTTQKLQVIGPLLAALNQHSNISRDTNYYYEGLVQWIFDARQKEILIQSSQSNSRLASIDVQLLYVLIKHEGPNAPPINSNISVIRSEGSMVNAQRQAFTINNKLMPSGLNHPTQKLNSVTAKSGASVSMDPNHFIESNPRYQQFMQNNRSAWRKKDTSFPWKLQGAKPYSTLPKVVPKKLKASSTNQNSGAIRSQQNKISLPKVKSYPTTNPTSLYHQSPSISKATSTNYIQHIPSASGGLQDPGNIEPPSRYDSDCVEGNENDASFLNLQIKIPPENSDAINCILSLAHSLAEACTKQKGLSENKISKSKAELSGCKKKLKLAKEYDVLPYEFDLDDIETEQEEYEDRGNIVVPEEEEEEEKAYPDIQDAVSEDQVSGENGEEEDTEYEEIEYLENDF